MHHPRGVRSREIHQPLVGGRPRDMNQLLSGGARVARFSRLEDGARVTCVSDAHIRSQMRPTDFPNVQTDFPDGHTSF